MKDKLAIIIRAVNFVKTSAVNTRLFAVLCKDMDSNHETLLFHISVRWLSKGNMLARVYEMKDELKLFLEAHGKQESPSIVHVRGVSAAVGLPHGYFPRA